MEGMPHRSITLAAAPLQGPYFIQDNRAAWNAGSAGLWTNTALIALFAARRKPRACSADLFVLWCVTPDDGKLTPAARPGRCSTRRRSTTRRINASRGQTLTLPQFNQR
jgi:hypothetical protein